MAAIFDYAGSLRRMGNDQTLFQEMVTLLNEDAPQYLASIHQCTADHDYPTLKRAAHTLKGLVLNFGATRAVLAAVALENLAATAAQDAAEQNNLPAAIDELEQSLKELQQALSDHHPEHCTDGRTTAPAKHSNSEPTRSSRSKH
jgi:HPt (histidine-containing phosphotransfer) domain-containing protein